MAKFPVHTLFDPAVLPLGIYTSEEVAHIQNGMFTKLVVAALFAVIQRHWKHPQCPSA